MDTETTKLTPCWKKSEFWVTCVTNISGILLALGIITPDQSSSLSTNIQSIVGGIMAILSTFKFVSTQQAAKVEVFRAMCAMKLEAKATDSKAKASSINNFDVAKMAKEVGL